MVLSGRCRERWGRFLQGGWEGDASKGCQAWGGHLPVQISSSPISCLAGISLSSVLLPPPTPPPPLPPPGLPPAAAPPPATEPFIWPSSVRENTDFLEEEGGPGKWGSQSWEGLKAPRTVPRIPLISPTKIIKYLKIQRKMWKMMEQYPHTGHPDFTDV